MFELDTPDENLKQEFELPKKCVECKNTPICTVFSTIIGISKSLGIIVDVLKCPYSGTKPNE